MNFQKNQNPRLVIFPITFFGSLLMLSGCAEPQTQESTQPQMQAVDENGAPVFQVDPFWPGPLPNRWSMQQVTGIYVDHMDIVWFLNRPNGAEGDEIGGGEELPYRMACCVAGPEVVAMDQDANVVHAWGNAEHHPRWPR
ncbi:MAG: hypothetical protein VX225_05950, partial [Pseudomonadota bacterium]|nr:hypothetical protein [Pseudomonadota bacterium]